MEFLFIDGNGKYRYVILSPLRERLILMADTSVKLRQRGSCCGTVLGHLAGNGMSTNRFQESMGALGAQGGEETGEAMEVCLPNKFTFIYL